MPDLSHFWQRFVLGSALVFGLAVGIGATVFAYSNTAPVNLGWSVFHIDGVPLWAVVLAPLALVLVAGTLFHWWNSFHHFTEHMRHRHRVRELEAEVTSLRKHLDELLQMPGHAETASEATAAAEPEPLTSDGEGGRTADKQLEAQPVAVAANGSSDIETDTKAVSDIVPTAGS